MERGRFDNHQGVGRQDHGVKNNWNNPRGRDERENHGRGGGTEEHKHFTGNEKNSIEEGEQAIRTLLPECTVKEIESMQRSKLLRPGDFDERAVQELALLEPKTQLCILATIKQEKKFFMNSRTKSGYLVSVCSKARRGELDPRGFKLDDPYMESLATVPKISYLVKPLKATATKPPPGPPSMVILTCYISPQILSTSPGIPPKMVVQSDTSWTVCYVEKISPIPLDYASAKSSM